MKIGNRTRLDFKNFERLIEKMRNTENDLRMIYQAAQPLSAFSANTLALFRIIPSH